ncbi:HNH endonuclease family protein [Nocardia australiensis]|uniref:HNH endonuclease family protein n=1 Tax=Nocardia australiensis TaxID=2887191 RepID=UPI001D142C08|nr:HNH endonuclease family protein [Nocardia australiensis]
MKAKSVPLLCVAALVVALWVRDDTHSSIVASDVRLPLAAFPPASASARTMLHELSVAWNEHGETYARNAFGPGWSGHGGEPLRADGCTARDVVLRRDLHDLRMADRNPCVVLSGSLDDPYTGALLLYDRFQASELEIDHLVPLGNAWRSGAWDWPTDRREQMANDVDNLVAVARRANRDKGSRSPDRWRPRPEYRCEYARRWIALKTRYALHVTPPERDALDEMLDACSGQ